MLQRNENPRTDFRYRKGPYLYFRFPQKFRVKPITLPADENSLAFERAYDHCLATLRKMEADADGAAEPARPVIRRAKTGSIAQAIEIYLRRSPFEALKPKTQRIYRGVLDRIKKEIGDGELRALDRDALEDFAELMFEESGSASMTDLYITIINNVWKTVRKDPQFGVRKLANPTIEIERRHKDRDSKPHLKWNEEVQDRFEDTAPAYLVFAKEVLHFTAQRGGDAIRMKWADYDGRGIKVWPEKTTAKGAILDPKYHLLPDPLIELLNAAKQTATAETILVNKWGKPWAIANNLAQAIRRHMVKVGIRKKGVKGPGMHGLRHTGASDVAALPGVGIKGIMSATGHASPRQAMHYAAQADKARINAQTIAAWNADLEEKAKTREARRRAKMRDALKVVK